VTKAIGIDIGGTFIDLVLSDESGLRLYKFPSTPDAPERGVLHALGELIERDLLEPSSVDRMAHGSTVATNALLEGAWAKTALITTRGFRDVLEIGRQNRSHLYDLNVDRPVPIVSRDLRFECSERLDAAGDIIRDLSDGEIVETAERLTAEHVEAVAVVFLFSYLNAAHEQRVGELLREKLGIPITLSSDVLPEFREYERTSTTAVCASLRPVIERYMRNLADQSVGLGITPEWQIMQSNGTVISATQAQREPVRILLSGPAAGVQGSRCTGGQDDWAGHGIAESDHHGHGWNQLRCRAHSGWGNRTDDDRICWPTSSRCSDERDPHHRSWWRQYCLDRCRWRPAGGAEECRCCAWPGVLRTRGTATHSQ